MSKSFKEGDKVQFVDNDPLGTGAFIPPKGDLSTWNNLPWEDATYCSPAKDLGRSWHYLRRLNGSMVHVPARRIRKKPEIKTTPPRTTT